MAVIECNPTVSVAIVNLVTPELKGRPAASVVVPSMNVTVPVRLPVPAPVVTAAVKVTACPKFDGLRLETSATVVELTGVAMPTNRMSSGELSVAPETFTLPASGLPATDGANSAPTTQEPSTARKGLPGKQVVGGESTAAFASGVMDVRSRAALPSFSIVWLLGADVSPWRTGGTLKSSTLRLLWTFWIIM